MDIDRRTFVAAGLTAASARGVLGASNTIRLGLIGCGNRGRYLTELAMKQPGVHFVAACDVWSQNREKARDLMGGSVALYGDFRRLIDNRKIDAVIVATPEHWHAIPAIQACQAGKDVYVEKPLCHNVREGRRMVEAAREYNRIVQTGTQHRSAPHFPEFHERVRAGEFGTIHSVRCFHYRNRVPSGIGHTPDEPPPSGMDWDMFCGPAPWVPFSRNRLNYWLQYYEFSGGSVTDMAVHYFDTVHEIMGVEFPVSVTATGGRFLVKDDGEVPDVLQIVYQYPNFTLTWDENRTNGFGIGRHNQGVPYHQSKGTLDHPTGMIFHGSGATIVADRLGYEIFSEAVHPTRLTGPVRRGAEDVAALHLANFFECVRSRKRPKADVETGHRATLVGHIGNIAYRTNRKLEWDPVHESFPNAGPAVQAMLSRTYRVPWRVA